MSIDQKAIVHLPGEAESVSVVGAEVAFLATGEQTGGEDAVIMFATSPGYIGPELHLHPHTAETIYILEGEFTMWSGDNKFTAPAGTFVRVPRNTPHTFANPTDSTANQLVFLAPSGRGKLFTEGAEIENIHGSPLPPEKVKELYAKYDTEPV